MVLVILLPVVVDSWLMMSQGVVIFNFNTYISFFFSPGILLLTVALFVSARMGIYQEVLYKRYGKHPRESLYYTVCIVKYLLCI